MNAAWIPRTLMAAACAGALVAAACGGSSNSPTSPSTPSGGGGGGSTTPTLTALSASLFTPRCSGCHGGSSPSAGMNLEAGNVFESLVNVPSRGKAGAIRVIPGDAENSYLIHKLRGDSDIVGLRMPRNGPPYLTDDEINQVKQWIQDGAKNN